MSLWISSTEESGHRPPPPAPGGARLPGERARSFGTYVLVGLLGLSLGLWIGQIAGEHRSVNSRIAWPAPALPHPRTLAP